MYAFNEQRFTEIGAQLDTVCAEFTQLETRAAYLVTLGGDVTPDKRLVVTEVMSEIYSEYKSNSARRLELRELIATLQAERLALT